MFLDMTEEAFNKAAKSLKIAVPGLTDQVENDIFYCQIISSIRYLARQYLFQEKLTAAKEMEIVIDLKDSNNSTAAYIDRVTTQVSQLLVKYRPVEIFANPTAASLLKLSTLYSSKDHQIPEGIYFDGSLGDVKIYRCPDFLFKATQDKNNHDLGKAYFVNNDDKVYEITFTGLRVNSEITEASYQEFKKSLEED